MITIISRNSAKKRRHRAKTGQLVVMTSCLLCCAVGCQSLFQRNDSIAEQDPFSNVSQNSSSIENIQGPVGRSLRAETSAGFRQYSSAKQLFEQGSYASAEKAFKKIAYDHRLEETGFVRKRRWNEAFKARSQLQAHYSDSPLREDALFMLAESQFKQNELPGAETNYLQLLQEYPNTRHMDATTQRLFDIAMTWMDFKTTKSGDVQLAAYSDDGPSAKPQIVNNKEYKQPGFFNFTNKKRPITDTTGRALEALKAIWLNDPTGKLADDALMFTASHYLRTGRYTEAAETYRLLRDEFPNSPHTKDAYVLGAYVSQASYQGAAYDGKNLTESRQLQMMAANLYPNIPAEEKQRLQQSLTKIEDATVARDFNRAIFWLRKGRFDAVEMSCHHIINTYPGSKYADKARGLLTKLPEYRKKNPLLLAIQGVDANSIEPRSELPPRPPIEQQPAPAVPLTSPAAPEKSSPFKLPKIKPIQVPNLLPSWSRESQPVFEPEPMPKSLEQKSSEPGRVNLTSGG